MDDDFLEALVAEFCKPRITVGSHVLVDGRPGVVIAEPPLSVTCTVAYDVHHHDGEVARYVVNDWNPNAPKVVFA